MDWMYARNIPGLPPVLRLIRFIADPKYAVYICLHLDCCRFQPVDLLLADLDAIAPPDHCSRPLHSSMQDSDLPHVSSWFIYNGDVNGCDLSCDSDFSQPSINTFVASSRMFSHDDHRISACHQGSIIASVQHSVGWESRRGAGATVSKTKHVISGA